MKHAVLSKDQSRAVEVFYDGVCPVCRAEVAVLQKAAEGAGITWRDVAASPEDPASDLGREDALARFHVRRADDTLASGAAAFLALWRNIGWLRPLAIALDRPPFRGCAEIAYRGFLIVRRLWRRGS